MVVKKKVIYLHSELKTNKINIMGCWSVYCGISKIAISDDMDCVLLPLEKKFIPKKITITSPILIHGLNLKLELLFCAIRNFSI